VLITGTQEQYYSRAFVYTGYFVSGNEQIEGDLTLQYHYVRPTEFGREILYLRTAELNCQNDPGLRRRSAAAWSLGSQVRIPLRAWIFCLVVAVCCVGSVLCDGLISRSEESYRICVCVCVCMRYLETLRMRRPKPDLGCWDTAKVKDSKPIIKLITRILFNKKVI